MAGSDMDAYMCAASTTFLEVCTNRKEEEKIEKKDQLFLFLIHRIRVL